MIVADFLPKVRANRYTYYNLNENTKRDFRLMYGYLVARKDWEINPFAVKEAEDELAKPNMDIVKKLRAIYKISIGLCKPKSYEKV